MTINIRTSFTGHMAAREVEVNDRLLEVDGFQWRVEQKEFRTRKTVAFFLVPVEGAMCIVRPQPTWKTFKRTTSLRVASN